MRNLALLAIAAAAACSQPRPAVDAATQPVFSSSWTMHVITPGSSTGIWRGADGIDRAPDGRLVTPWEEGGSVSVAMPPVDPTQPWPTRTIATGVAGVEDAKWGDFDGDGHLDVVSTSDGGQRIYLHFSQSDDLQPWTTITVTASLGHNHWMQASAIDVDGDGDLDVVAGSRVGTAANPAVIAWLENPGAGKSRNPGDWIYHQITLAGWAMTVEARDIDGDGDVDVFVTDRGSYRTPDNVIHWDLYGARWIEQTSADRWTNHAMETAGGCGTCTPGDEMFGELVDFDGDGVPDLLDGTSSAGHANRVAVHHNAGWTAAAPWPAALVTSSEVNTNVGHYQGLAAGDMDGDGRLDLVVSSWEANQLPASSATGVWWVRNVAAGSWEREEISGPAGTKFDNVLLVDVDGDGDPDVLESEQVEQLGVVWYENPSPNF